MRKAESAFSGKKRIFIKLQTRTYLSYPISLIDEYNAQCISRISQYLNFLNTQKGVSYIAKMASVIAIAWENHLLCDTYNNTLSGSF